MLGEFNLDQKEILNKKLIFNTAIIDEEIITIIDATNYLFNDKYWIEHKPGTNYLTLRLQNGSKKVLKEARTIFSSLKTDPNSVLFSEEKIDNRLLKNLKKIKIFKRFSATKTYNFSRQ